MASFTNTTADDEQSKGRGGGGRGEKGAGNGRNRSAFIAHANGGSLTFSNRRCLFNTIEKQRGFVVLVYHPAPGFFRCYEQREGKIRGREGEGEKEAGTRKCRPVITSLRVMYSGREGNGINHARWR